MKRLLVGATFFTGVGRSVGMIIPFVMAYVYGVGSHTDSFFLAFGIVNFILAVFLQLFESVMVPYLAEEKKNGQNMWAFAHQVFLRMLPWIAGICILVLMILPLFFKEPSQRLDITLTFIYLIPFLLLSVWTSAANGVFLTDKIFWVPSVSPAIRSFAVLACLALWHKPLGIHAVSLGFVAGELVRAGISLWLLRNEKDRKVTIAEAKVLHEKIRVFIRASFFQILALAAINGIYFIDLFFASRLSVGSVSLLNYADRLLQIPYLLFRGGVLQVFHSLWSENYQQQPFRRVYQEVSKHIKWVFCSAFVLSFFLWWAKDFLIGIAYGHSELTTVQLHVLTNVFGLLSFGFPAALVYLLYVRFLFVMRWAKAYLAIAVIHLMLKMGLNLIFLKPFEIQGIALSTTLSYVFLALGLFVYCQVIARRKMLTNEFNRSFGGKNAAY